jgi:hypothetical protein
MFLVPHPEESRVLLVPGVADCPLTRETLVVVDEAMHGLDGWKLRNSHSAIPSHDG